MPTTRSTHRRRPLMALPCLAALLAGASSQAAVLLSDFDLGGSLETTTAWHDFTFEGNPSRTPIAGTGTITISPTAFQGTFGFYSFTSDYAVTATQTASFDIASVVWQIECSPNPDLAWPYDGGPFLTVVTESGSEVLAPVAFRSGDSEFRDNFGPEPILYTAFAWQWNLSSIDETIASITLTAPIPVHTSVTASQIEVANSFLQVVPEPSAVLLSFAALPLLARRRRTTV
ncbi:hypothetical protein OKA05_13060 [Luteolibacter arcticus]|uniref:PEP-CTERM sorting domain-containing protein n=1 Tax=Luteolibacter arcticus TaxID=1581411 RepID=A0ABT3GIZ0_9BACT|nr:hypothetical protein [Luteolibacter arcticus]MCW1923487.1 hypothetical protein [Luteolibacter arcticus]